MSTDTPIRLKVPQQDLATLSIFQPDAAAASEWAGRLPIANPGRGSLWAALNPAEVDYLYFVSRNDGSHHFSRTLAEHNRAVKQYQMAGRRK